VVLGLLLSFLAGIWYPASLMPQWLRLLANVFPPTWVFNTVRNIIVFDSGLEEIGASLTEILVALTVILLLDIIVYKYRLRNTLKKHKSTLIDGHYILFRLTPEFVIT